MLIYTPALSLLKTLTTFGVKVDALKSLNDVDETVCIDPGHALKAHHGSSTAINCN